MNLWKMDLYNYTYIYIFILYTYIHTENTNSLKEIELDERDTDEIVSAKLNKRDM